MSVLLYGRVGCQLFCDSGTVNNQSITDYWVLVTQEIRHPTQLFVMTEFLAQHPLPIVLGYMTPQSIASMSTVNDLILSSTVDQCRPTPVSTGHYTLTTTDVVEQAIFGSEVLRALSNNTFVLFQGSLGVFSVHWVLESFHYKVALPSQFLHRCMSRAPSDSSALQ